MLYLQSSHTTMYNPRTPKRWHWCISTQHSSYTNGKSRHAYHNIRMAGRDYGFHATQSPKRPTHSNRHANLYGILGLFQPNENFFYYFLNREISQIVFHENDMDPCKDSCCTFVIPFRCENLKLRRNSEVLQD